MRETSFVARAWIAGSMAAAYFVGTPCFIHATLVRSPPGPSLGPRPFAFGGICRKSLRATLNTIACLAPPAEMADAGIFFA